MKPYCFVIMGFGKKTDYKLRKVFNLDETYESIKPIIKKFNYQCIRADEINHSQMIDKPMYELIYHSNLVVADITTLNPNAIYELGIRHALKPFSTIIIQHEEAGDIPFDLNHINILKYNFTNENNDFKNKFEKTILNINVKPDIDSPIYTLLTNLKPPILNSKYSQIFNYEEKTNMKVTEKNPYQLSLEANQKMKNNLFEEAFDLWSELNEICPSEIFYLQRKILCKYKSEKPSKLKALTDALTFLSTSILDVKNTSDLETIGLAGSINKRLYQEINDIHYLNDAIFYYGKGFYISLDFYNGENYAYCCNLLANLEKNEEEKIYYKLEAKKTREKIIQNLKFIQKEISNSKENKVYKWQISTLAKCYFALGNEDLSKKYETIFETVCDDWERDSYYENKKQLKKLLNN